MAVKKFLKLAVILGIFTLLSTGCANHATGSVSPSANLLALKTMYVKHYPSDNSGVDEQIADKLRSKGVTVTVGSEASPSSVDAVVTYVDRWMWDITMYMLELTINIRDPKTDSLIATGNSLHTSLTRKSQTEMVDEVINSIYKVPSATVASKVFQAPKHQPDQVTATSQQVPAPIPANKASEKTTPTKLSQKLQDLKALRDDGTITESEYKIKRKQLIEMF